MTSENVLHIGLDGKEYDTLSAAILILGDLEDMLRGNEQYEYTRDLYHETRCSLLRIQNERIIYDSGDYQITKKPTETNPMGNNPDYVKRLAERYFDYLKSMDYADECTSTIDDIISDFTKVNAKDNPILYYIEHLLDGVEV